MFREIRKNETFPELEARILELWDRDDSFGASLAQRNPANGFSFYDGPPFATGLPHYGHLLAGTLKDIIPRYWTMKGRHVPRRFGWDCHGLPIESMIQNELKLDGVAAIREYGIGNFNEACRSSVLRYTSEWRRTVRRMGRWVDFDNDYKTMDSSFMESVWWVFRQCWDRGLIYQGYRIQPYSPALATPLSNFETNQGYKDRQDPSLTLALALQDRPGEEILVWTTTPWTLPSNMALAMGAEVDYVLVADEAHYPDRKFWLAEARLGATFKADAQGNLPAILERRKGAELAGWIYRPLFRCIPEEGQSLYRIHLADFVSTGDGTGVVHIAPSFGEDDFQLGQALGLPLFDPLDTEGKFTELVPQWQGIGAKDADKGIIAHLKTQGRIFKHDTLVHSYPHCYRTGVPLLYRALKTWFLRLDVEITSAEGVTKSLKQWMIDSNQQINWVPGHIRDGRFGNWLEGARDWNISRNRFWGTPLPVWTAEDGDQICVGSKAELAALTGKPVDDLHMHIVDTLELRSSDGKRFDPQGKLYRRTPEVFDCWFESGSMPYAQNHYPFENKAAVEANFPADFIAEGLDQTRGWFYTLTVLAAALFQKPAFKNVIVNGIILAEDGQKMSKSLRNYPDPNELIDRTGADAIRLFLIDSAAVKAEDLRFTETGVRELVKQVLLPLWNALSLFTTYANADEAKGQLSWKPSQARASTHELDRWILAVQQELLEKVEAEMEAFRLYNVVPAIVEFIDSLTNWYIRRSRRRFWKSEDDGDKNDAYATLYAVLTTLARTLAPYLPFLSEEIWQILAREVDPSAPASVHLADFPRPDAQLKDHALVHRMQLVKQLVEMGRFLRAQNSLKNRQPLARITVVARRPEERQLVENMRELILDELNIRELAFAHDEEELVHLSAKANFKSLGARLGKQMKEVAAAIAQLSSNEVGRLMAGESLEAGGAAITSSDILVNRTVKEGLVVEANESFTIALDTVITPELDRAGMARELVSRIQQQRKELELQVTQRIRLRFSTPAADVRLALQEHSAYICEEVQADELLEQANLSGATSAPWTTEVNGREITLALIS